MSKRVVQIIKVVLSIGVAGLLLYFVFKNVEWAVFWKQAQSVEYVWVITSIFLSIVAYWSRAYRWNLLLQPLGHELSTSRTLLAVLIGYMANLALPRLGEITRCGVLNRNDNVPVSEALGSVVTERIVDMMTLLLLIVISLLLESERLLTFLKTAFKNLHIPTYLVYIILGIGVLSLVVLIFLIRKLKEKPGKVADIVNGFISGLLSLKTIKHPVGFIVSTVVLWVVYYFMSYLILFSLPETSSLGMGAGFMLLITGGIALSIPVQSGFGTYHGMIAGMLVLYSVNETTGVFLATLLHTSQIVAIAIFGSIALIRSATLRRKKSVKA